MVYIDFEKWICQECDFVNESILGNKCIFCSNRWKCAKCDLFNSNKYTECIVCGSPSITTLMNKYGEDDKEDDDDDYDNNDARNNAEYDEIKPVDAAPFMPQGAEGYDSFCKELLCRNCLTFNVTSIETGLCSKCFIDKRGIKEYEALYPKESFNITRICTNCESPYLSTTISTSERISDSLCGECNAQYQHRQSIIDGLSKNTIIKNNIIIEIIINFSVYPQPEYYHYYYCVDKESKDRIIKQLKMEDKMNKNINIKHHISAIKMMIDKQSKNEFFELLIELQPWMSIENVWDIIVSTIRNKPNDEGKSNIHKAMGLLYFAVDCYLSNTKYLKYIIEFIEQSLVICSLNQVTNGKNQFGFHVIKDHKFEDKVDQTQLLKYMRE